MRIATADYWASNLFNGPTGRLTMDVYDRTFARPGWGDVQPASCPPCFALLCLRIRDGLLVPAMAQLARLQKKKWKECSNIWWCF